MTSVVGTRANQTCARLASSSNEASVATSGEVSARASSQNATIATTLNERRDVVRRVGASGDVGHRQPHRKQVEEVRLHRVDARIQLDAAGEQVEHARRITFAKEDRVPVRGRHQVEQRLGMDQRVVPDQAAADAEVDRAVAAVDEELAWPRGKRRCARRPRRASAATARADVRRRPDARIARQAHDAATTEAGTASPNSHDAWNRPASASTIPTHDHTATAANTAA